ncbi:hypothetical protein [Haladaptatus cibarius]|uniref:hypothetical protein n=1 Tax=Haladaptatus cibarius TaxID=453847 RepID=UPI00067944E4|nr:hypothetical protein [Haladaptatus cibarius]
MSSNVRSTAPAADRESGWWLLILPGLVMTIAAAMYQFFSSMAFSSAVVESLPSLPAPVTFIVMVSILTAPALVAIGIHFDRKYVASVSAWEPRSEYILLGIAMWFGIGIPLALLYLFRRHKYVGVP